MTDEKRADLEDDVRKLKERVKKLEEEEHGKSAAKAIERKMNES